MRKPNLFSFATSELSQDAFICWLLSWAKPENKEIDANLHACGVAMIQTFFEKHSKPFPAEIRTVEVKKQDENIDVLCIVNGEYPIIIEDKTLTINHGNQLANYMERIEKRIDAKGNSLYKKENIIPIYFKTYDQASYKNIIDTNKYQAFTRTDFLSILNGGNELGIDNAIFNDFREHLMLIESRVQSYLTLDPNQWKSQSWVGFYSKLQQELGVGHWNYVSNPTGGFMGFWWGLGQGKPYLQLEHGKLCFKIKAVDDSTAKRKSMRNKWYALIKSQCTDFGIELEKPTRFGNGNYMTVIVAKEDYRHKNNEGNLDFNATVEHLRKMSAFMKVVQNLESTI